MIILGIETSCDECSVAILDSKKIKANIICSQTEIHKQYGGVVPELASRDHLMRLPIVTDEAIKKASISLKDIEAIAVTSKPGLIGALFVGLSFAKSLSLSLSIPYVGVNHLQAHLYSIFLEQNVEFPFIGLTVSGGHTSLTLVEEPLKETVLGNTYDDAAGEAFDKVAKSIGLPYPGGPELEKTALKGDSQSIKFPRPLCNKKNKKDKYSFSFSGLKSNVINYIREKKNINLNDLAASFQMAVVDTLITKLKWAAEDYKVSNIVLAGGVARNGLLREKVLGICKKHNYNFYVPSPILCTDNAAMIANLGEMMIEKGYVSSYELGARSRL